MQRGAAADQSLSAHQRFEEYRSSSDAFFQGLFRDLGCYSSDLPLKRGQGLLVTSVPSFVGGQRVPKGPTLFGDGAPGWQEDLAVRNVTCCQKGDESLSAALEATIRADAAARVDDARRKLKAKATEGRNGIAVLGLRQSFFSRHAKELLETVRMRHELYGGRLEVQHGDAVRRLQELVCDCVGEYEKARQRAVLRAEYLRSDHDEQKRLVYAGLVWSRFALRLSQDMLGLVTAAHVDQRASAEEFRSLASWAQQALWASEGLRTSVTNVVRLDGGSTSTKSRKNGVNGGLGDHGAVGYVLGAVQGADDPVLANLLWHAACHVDRRVKKCVPVAGYVAEHAIRGTMEPAALVTRAVSGADGAGGVKRTALETLLSSEVVRWLVATHGGDEGRACEPVNSRVYYCVEERALRVRQRKGKEDEMQRRSSVRAEAVCEHIEIVYVEPGVGLQTVQTADLSRGTMRVAATKHAHRRLACKDVPKELVEASPDVLEAEALLDDGGVGRLHFACASVLQLVEGPVLRSLLHTLTPETLTKLQSWYPVSLLDGPLSLFVAVRDIACPSPQAPPSATTNPQDSTLSACRLLPLSPTTVLELIHTHVLSSAPRLLSSSDVTSLRTPLPASAMTVLPPRMPLKVMSSRALHISERTRYCVIVQGDAEAIFSEAERTQLHSPAAALVEYVELDAGSDGDGGGHEEVVRSSRIGCAGSSETAACRTGRGRKKAGGKRSAPEWDNTILGPFCWWRSCVSMATHAPADGEKHVCEVHGEIKRFLDGRVGGKGVGGGGGKERGSAVSESAKYLPRKPSGEGAKRVGGRLDKDLSYMLQASSLLQEMLSGKLTETVRNFCKVTARESSEKYMSACPGPGNRKALRSKPQQHDRPFSTAEIAWARWRNWEEYQQRAQQLELEIEAASKVHKLERAITSELHQLKAKKVFPQSELQQMRAEYQRHVNGAASDDGQEESGSDRWSGGPAWEEGSSRSSSPFRGIRGDRRPADSFTRQSEIDFAELKFRLLRTRRLQEDAADADAALETSSVSSVVSGRSSVAVPPLVSAVDGDTGVVLGVARPGGKRGQRPPLQPQHEELRPVKVATPPLPQNGVSSLSKPVKTAPQRFGPVVGAPHEAAGRERSGSLGSAAPVRVFTSPYVQHPPLRERPKAAMGRRRGSVA